MLQNYRTFANRYLISVSIFVAALMPRLATAEPIQITSGNIAIFPILDGGIFSVRGPDLSITIRNGFVGVPAINHVPIGVPLAPTFVIGAGGLSQAVQVPGFRNEPDQVVALSGTLHFRTSSVVFEDPMTPFAGFSFPFTMTGTISGTSFDQLHRPLFTIDVFGAGRTSFGPLKRIESGLGISYGDAFMVSQDITFAPVPEPGTILLCASGVLALCARGRRARR